MPDPPNESKPRGTGLAILKKRSWRSGQLPRAIQAFLIISFSSSSTNIKRFPISSLNFFLASIGIVTWALVEIFAVPSTRSLKSFSLLARKVGISLYCFALQSLLVGNN